MQVLESGSGGSSGGGGGGNEATEPMGPREGSNKSLFLLCTTGWFPLGWNLGCVERQMVTLRKSAAKGP